MEDGGWRMEDGGWRMEDGGWRHVDFFYDLCMMIAGGVKNRGTYFVGR
jgi:hypothetical protein